MVELNKRANTCRAKFWLVRLAEQCRNGRQMNKMNLAW